ncbi:hypothetical protein IFM89_007397 [Coptis chinensis]|uniref:PHD finger transcription factor n=1 Tax=Coptis chinensis TaxID=261450 RepID=A0A835M552_9MAGN|nr:hypothetical protein IFM89_007397 [Coptis chinensis]
MNEKKLLLHQRVEVRQFEEGLRGSWHAGEVVGTSDFCRSVKYDELLSEADNSKLVEEIPVSKAVEGLCQRRRVLPIYRGCIRPFRPDPPTDGCKPKLSYGLCIDAFYEDAWWEGVLFDQDECLDLDKLSVFFPDEGDERKFSVNDLRVSRDWDEHLGVWKDRGTWIMTELAKEFERNDGILSVFVKKVWLHLRENVGFKKMISEWTCGGRDMWSLYFAEVIAEMAVESSKPWTHPPNILRTRGSKQKSSAHVDLDLHTKIVNHSNIPFRASGKNEGPTNSRKVGLDLQFVSEIINPPSIPFDTSRKGGTLKNSRQVVLGLRAPLNIVNSPAMPAGTVRKRGRPRKSMQDDLDLQLHHKIINPYIPSDTSRKRGRPKKYSKVNLDLQVHSINPFYIPSGTSRKRGRPRKFRQDDLDLQMHPKIMKRAKNSSFRFGVYAAALPYQKKLLRQNKMKLENPGSRLTGKHKDKNSNAVKGLTNDFLQVTKEGICSGSSCCFLQSEKRMSRVKHKNNRQSVKKYLEIKKSQEHTKFVTHRRPSPPFSSLKRDTSPKDKLSRPRNRRRRMSSDQSDTICSVCQYGGKLIICDYCPSSYHLSCVDLKVYPSVADVPDGKWFCPSCQCGICAMRDSDSDLRPLTSICYQCSRQYHMDCLSKLGLASAGSTGQGKFCSQKCFRIFEHLNQLLGKPNPTFMEGVFWRIMRSQNSYSLHGGTSKTSYDRDLSQALKLMHLSFEPCNEPHTNRDLVTDVIFNRMWLENKRTERLNIGLILIVKFLRRCALSGRNEESFKNLVNALYKSVGAVEQLLDSFRNEDENEDEEQSEVWGNYSTEENDDLQLRPGIYDGVMLPIGRPLGLLKGESGERASGMPGISLRIKEVEWRPPTDDEVKSNTVVMHLGTHAEVELEWSLGTVIQIVLGRKLFGTATKYIAECNALEKFNSWVEANFAAIWLQRRLQPEGQKRHRLLQAGMLWGGDILGSDFVPRWSKLKRLDFHGFYTMILQKGHDFISVATVRILGKRVAEMPLIATSFQYRHQGMCRLLVQELEKMLSQLGIERLLLPAIPQLMKTWKTSFGFTEVSLQQRLELLGYPFVGFQGTTLCQKFLTEAREKSCGMLNESRGIVRDVSLESQLTYSGLAVCGLYYKRDQLETSTGNGNVLKRRSECIKTFKYVYKRRRILASKNSVSAQN